MDVLDLPQISIEKKAFGMERQTLEGELFYLSHYMQANQSDLLHWCDVSGEWLRSTEVSPKPVGTEVKQCSPVTFLQLLLLWSFRALKEADWFLESMIRAAENAVC